MSTTKIDKLKNALLDVIGMDLKVINLQPLRTFDLVDKKGTSENFLYVEYPGRRFRWMDYQNWTCCGSYRSFGATYLGTKGHYVRGIGLTFIVCHKCSKYLFDLGDMDGDSVLKALRTWIKTL